MLQGAPQPHFGISCGLFYNQKIYKTLGISTGIEYEQIRYYNPPAFFDDAYNINYGSLKYQSLHLVQVPLDITLRMNENDMAKCLVYFTIGYAFGETFEQSFVSSEGHTVYSTNIFKSLSNASTTNSFRMGLEARYDPTPKVNLAFGIQYKYVSPYVGKSNYGLNPFSVLGAYIKTGLNFPHKKAMLKKS